MLAVFTRDPGIIYCCHLFFFVCCGPESCVSGMRRMTMMMHASRTGADLNFIGELRVCSSMRDKCIGYAGMRGDIFCEVCVINFIRVARLIEIVYHCSKLNPNYPELQSSVCNILFNFKRIVVVANKLLNT